MSINAVNVFYSSKKRALLIHLLGARHAPSHNIVLTSTKQMHFHSSRLLYSQVYKLWHGLHEWCQSVVPDSHIVVPHSVMLILDAWALKQGITIWGVSLWTHCVTGQFGLPHCLLITPCFSFSSSAYPCLAFSFSLHVCWTKRKPLASFWTSKESLWRNLRPSQPHLPKWKHNSEDTVLELSRCVHKYSCTTS